MKPSNRLSYMTPERNELLKWFQRNAPSLGELYEGALEIIYAGNFPGKTRFVAHAVREIRNRLPDVIGGTQSKRFDWKSRLDDLSKRWKNAGFESNLFETTEIPKSSEIPISRNLFVKISDLVRDHEASRERPYEAAERLYIIIDPKNEPLRDTLLPIINQWLEVTGLFVTRAHDSGKTDFDHNCEELKENFNRFETILIGIIGKFFERLEEIDAILEEANS